LLFSQKALSPFDIAVDSREDSQNPFFREYCARRGLRVAVVKHEEGDVYITAGREGQRGVVVERKSWEDLANSIVDNRLWLQASRLRDLQERGSVKCYALIEGDPLQLAANREIPFNSLLSALDLLQTRYGLTVLFTPNKSYSADWLAHLSFKVKERADSGGAVEPVLVQKPLRKATVEDRVRAVVRVLAGPVLGERLLRKFGSLKELVNASLPELMTVEGIGERRARELYLTFNKRIHQER